MASRWCYELPWARDLSRSTFPEALPTLQLTAMSQHRAGTLRILAVTSGKRLAGLPDIPTMAEAGVKGIDQWAWFSLFGPRGRHSRMVVGISDMPRNAPVQLVLWAEVE